MLWHIIKYHIQTHDFVMVKYFNKLERNCLIDINLFVSNESILILLIKNSLKIRGYDTEIRVYENEKLATTQLLFLTNQSRRQIF